MKAGVFDGPQIRQLSNDEDFVNSISEPEECAWRAFVNIVLNFLGNRKAENYKESVSRLLGSYHQLGCNMNIKVHFLLNRLDQFPDNLGDHSDEQGERFHQDLKVMEDRHKGRWDISMLADYCWSVKRDEPLKTHREYLKGDNSWPCVNISYTLTLSLVCRCRNPSCFKQISPKVFQC